MQMPRFPLTKVRVESYSAAKIKKTNQGGQMHERKQKSQESSDSVKDAFKKSYT